MKQFYSTLCILCLSISFAQVGINTSDPSEMLDVEGNIELNGALKGSGRIYVVDDTESTYNNQSSGVYNTKISATFPSGTYVVWIGFSADGIESEDGSTYNDWIYWKLIDSTHTQDIIGETYTLTNDGGYDTPVDHYFRPFTIQRVLTFTEETQIDLQFSGYYGVKVKDVSIVGLRLN